MKPSTALKKVKQHEAAIKALLEPLSERISEVLEDGCAHILVQPGDGLCVAYRSGLDNASLKFLDVDELMKIQDKEEMLKLLDSAAI